MVSESMKSAIRSAIIECRKKGRYPSQEKISLAVGHNYTKLNKEELAFRESVMRELKIPVRVNKL